MNRFMLSSVIGLVAMTGTAVPAFATAFTVTPGSTFLVPANNDFQATLAGLGLGSFTAGGASVSLSVPRQLKFEYVGSESGFVDTFTGGSLAPFAETNMNQGVGNFTSVLIGLDNFAAGALTNVQFNSSGGVNPSTIGMPSFGIFIPTNTVGTYKSNVLYFGFDDQLNNIDDNHDDFILRVTAVPEPSTWLSMILGFGVLGAVARRRRARLGTNLSVLS